ncbi:hypothetical protein Lal_00043613 [Lupinus albus]|nr:hypothetical protein Lal_00043613 [Lupinus albus]
MNQMWHVRGSQSPFPYAIFITKIFEHFSVLLEGETKVALNRLESKVDIEVVHKMGFVIDPVTRRTYKHRTDRQPAPTDEPEPTKGGAYMHTYKGSILKTNQDISSSMLISENYTFKKTLVCHHQKGGDCEEYLAPDLGTVLMKTPISQKEERKKTDKDYRR